ncbi:MAG: hypothetical protein KJZ92_05750 [Rhodocyclaceae bacterium]|jgi:hypothetical protein|nr:hypothetical protein [Rhodocyclaceae bacterium]MCL4680760.1 hypothetical protein [Rhodocyclaceae bacterium]
MRESATLSVLLAAACLATAGCVTTAPSGLAGPAAQEEPATGRTQAASAGREAPAPVRQGAVAPPAPAAAAPAGPQPDAVIKLSPGSERLAPEMEARLAKIAEAARRDERVMLRLESYVPDGGSPSVNLLRAEQSLHLVKKRLVDMAVNPRRIVMAPFGGEYTTARDERRHWVEIYLIRPRL